MRKIKHFRKYAFLFVVFAMGCNADLTTKHWAGTKLKHHASVEVLPQFLNFTYVENPAIAFGFLHQLSERVRLPLIFTLTATASAFVLILLWQWRRKKLVELLPLSLILAGAAGNITDRMNNGFVVDFIHFHYQYQYSFYVFNVAYALVFCGVCWLIYQNWRETASNPAG